MEQSPLGSAASKVCGTRESPCGYWVSGHQGWKGGVNPNNEVHGGAVRLLDQGAQAYHLNKEEGWS